MAIGELVVDIIKVGTVTVIGCKVTKVLGQKEISELISGAGTVLVGVDVLGIVTPICNGIMSFTKSVGDVVNAVNNAGMVISKIFHIGG